MTFIRGIGEQNFIFNQVLFKIMHFRSRLKRAKTGLERTGLILIFTIKCPSLALLQVLVKSCRLDGHIVLVGLLPGAHHSFVGPLECLAAQRLPRVLLFTDLS